MPKAILKNGVILPLEPVPAEWADGRELRVEAVVEDDDESDFDAWLSDLQALVGGNHAPDFIQIEQALLLADEQAKNLVRKEMGLP